MNSAGLALVAGHGDYASGLVSAAAEIVGEISSFITMSNRNLGADEIHRLMRELVSSRGVRVIFTDLPAGSCTIAARKIVRDHPDVILVTGANLAALLHFASHEAGTAYEAASSAAERAKASVLVVGSPGGN